MNVQTIFDSAEIAFASYAVLRPGDLQTQLSALQMRGGGLSAIQAEEFAKKYPTVVTQYNDTLSEGGLGTSLSATVFKDASGNLTLAIRGTAELTGSQSNDLFPTDADIAFNGAGYDQIVALHNWWRRVSSPSGSTVLQYKIAAGPIDPHNGIQFGTQWLEIGSAIATGDLVSTLTADPNQKIDVTKLKGSETFSPGTYSHQ